MGCLANDLTFLDNLVFISDSFSNRIYSLDTHTLQVSIYSSSKLYAGAPSPLVGGLAIGLEGFFIPEDSDYIVVSTFSDGSGSNPGTILMQVPNEDPNNPQLLHVEGLDSTLAGGLDGIVYDYDTCNLYASNFQGDVYRIYSDNDWNSAVIDEVAPVTAVHNKPPLGPTVSVVLAPDGSVFALDAGGFNTQGTGTIQQVTFTTPATYHCINDITTRKKKFGVRSTQ